MLKTIGNWLKSAALTRSHPAKQAPAANREPRVDAYGDALRPGVRARMGTLRDFIGEGSSRVIFSADGKFVTASSEWFRPEVRLWDPASGRVVRDFKDIERSGIDPRQVAISPDITRIAVADGNANAFEGTPRRSTRWQSRWTARRWHRQATMERQLSGI